MASSQDVWLSPLHANIEYQLPGATVKHLVGHCRIQGDAGLDGLSVGCRKGALMQHELQDRGLYFYKTIFIINLRLKYESTTNVLKIYESLAEVPVL